MNLPVIKARPYISPSALATWGDCQYKFWLQYLSNYPWIKPEPSLAGTIGNVFDCYVKADIAMNRSMNRIDLKLDNMLAKLKKDVGPEIFEEAHRIGSVVAGQYLHNNMHQEILDAKDIILDREIWSLVNSIPILGIPDCVVDGVVMDWKTRGFISKTLPSPTKGYRGRWGHDNVPKGVKDWPEGTCLEEANIGWARQMLFYNWMLKSSVDSWNPTTLRYKIHEIIKTKDGWDLCVHSGVLSMFFEAKVLLELTELWESINSLDAEIMDPAPNNWRCKKYGQLCQVASYCDRFKEWVIEE